MVDILNKRCKEVNCDILITNKYKGYCLRCFIFKFPNEKISRNYKVKENHMTDFIKHKYEDDKKDAWKKLGVELDKIIKN